MARLLGALNLKNPNNLTLNKIFLLRIGNLGLPR